MTSLQPLILCALAHEARIVGRASTSLPTPIAVGPGRAAGEAVARLGRPGQRVVLIGTAGGLRPSFFPPLAFAVREACDEHGARWSCAAALGDAPTARALTVDAPVATAQAKAILARTHDAELVDCESSHVAAAAVRLGLEWIVIRGVSDGPDDALPEGVAQWVDAKGHTKPWRVLRSMLRDPRRMPSLMRLARESGAALASATRLAEQVLALARPSQSDPARSDPAPSASSSLPHRRAREARA